MTVAPILSPVEHFLKMSEGCLEELDRTRAIGIEPRGEDTPYESILERRRY